MQVKKARVAIVGATGYTARELILLLLRHPFAEITQLVSRSPEPIPISEIHPILRDRVDLRTNQFDVDRLLDAAVEYVFCCLPHAASAKIVRELLERGIKVVDLSADYRLNDTATFEKWYGVEHPDPDRVGNVPYGLPELFREQIGKAELVANPGCFPTSAILPLAPLLQQEWICPETIIVDSKTGVSGGGRNPKPNLHFPECNESIAAYGVGTHRHGPEIEQILGRVLNRSPQIVFVPHLVPMERGILSTIYCSTTGNRTETEVFDLLKTHFADEPFVRIVDQLPATRHVSGTNYCDISIRLAGEKLVIISAIDNLIKGASGAALQNLNLMMGCGETIGLLD